MRAVVLPFDFSGRSRPNFSHDRLPVRRTALLFSDLGAAVCETEGSDFAFNFRAGIGDESRVGSVDLTVSLIKAFLVTIGGNVERLMSIDGD